MEDVSTSQAVSLWLGTCIELSHYISGNIPILVQDRAFLLQNISRKWLMTYQILLNHIGPFSITLRDLHDHSPIAIFSNAIFTRGTLYYSAALAVVPCPSVRLSHTSRCYQNSWTDRAGFCHGCFFRPVLWRVLRNSGIFSSFKKHEQ